MAIVSENGLNDKESKAIKRLLEKEEEEEEEEN